MLFAVHCLDQADALPRRLAHYAEHKAHLQTGPVKTIISGPLLAEDEETMIGSLFVFAAKSLEEVRDYHARDPFHRAGVWGQVTITRFLLRVDNRDTGGDGDAPAEATP